MSFPVAGFPARGCPRIGQLSVTCKARAVINARVIPDLRAFRLLLRTTALPQAKSLFSFSLSLSLSFSYGGFIPKNDLLGFLSCGK